MAVFSESCRRRYMPSLSIALPKYVTINNPRLSFLYWVVMTLFLLVVIFYFITNKAYTMETEPDIKVSLCGSQCQPSAADLDLAVASSAPYCTAGSEVLCAQRCGNGASSSGPCLHEHEYIVTDSSMSPNAFIPTFFTETYSDFATTPCAAGFEPAASGGCVQEGSYYVAGAESIRLNFTHGLEVVQSAAVGGASESRSHQGAYHSQGWESGMVTILFDADRNEKKRFSQTEYVSLTLKELLECAYFTGRDGVDLSLDSNYTRPELGLSSPVPLRMTGAVLTVDIFVTDQETCTIYDYVHDGTGTDSVTIDTTGGPVACMFVHAERLETSEEESIPIGETGMRTRKTNGVHVRFRTQGRFLFFDLNGIVMSLTVFCVWMQIPLVLAHYFAKFCLGNLSTIYNRVINQELNLAEACKGVAARLLSHSGAFMDLMDPNDEENDDDEQEAGISKQKILARIRELLPHHSINHEEILRMADFMFTSLQSSRPEGERDDVVRLSEFCNACCSNEPLSFDSLVKIFDKDREVSFMESVFMDDAIRTVHQAAEVQVQRTPSFSPSHAALAKPGGESDSRIQKTMKEMQRLLNTLSETETKAHKAAKDLAPDSDILEQFGEVGEVEPPAGQNFPHPVKTSIRGSEYNAEG